ncbi:MAG: hypothetical protein FJ388_25935, partial [Verrucomicrobia bacterium]|nr:hypothetical protein [Verrucomicrobiota bacterium]
MGIRVYELSKKYGVENAVLIEKLHALGYKQVKQPSNTIDKITAEYLVNELGLKEVAPPPPVAPPAPKIEAPPPAAAPPAPVVTAPAPTPKVAAPKPAVSGKLVAPAPPKPAPPLPAAPEGPKPGTQVPDKPVMPASLLRATIPPDRIIQMRPPVVVKDLAPRLKLKPFQLISELMALGVFAKA